MFLLASPCTHTYCCYRWHGKQQNQHNTIHSFNVKNTHHKVPGETLAVFEEKHIIQLVANIYEMCGNKPVLPRLIHELTNESMACWSNSDMRAQYRRSFLSVTRWRTPTSESHVSRSWQSWSSTAQSGALTADVRFTRIDAPSKTFVLRLRTGVFLNWRPNTAGTVNLSNVNLASGLNMP